MNSRGSLKPVSDYQGLILNGEEVIWNLYTGVAISDGNTYDHMKK